jgi:hypothetical protein
MLFAGGNMRRLVLPFLCFASLVAASACGPDCDDIRRDSEALVESYAACSQGDGCIVVDMYELVGSGSDNCLSAFQCSAALRDGTDVDAFAKKARALADDYEGCDECAIAGCVGPGPLTASCNTSTGRCEIER